MKVLVITSEHVVKPERMHREVVRMGEEAAKYGIMWLPNDCKGKVVEFDAICAGQDYASSTSNPAEVKVTNAHRDCNNCRLMGTRSICNARDTCNNYSHDRWCCGMARDIEISVADGEEEE